MVLLVANLLIFNLTCKIYFIKLIINNNNKLIMKYFNFILKLLIIQHCTNLIFSIF
jgi:hypothetical protein